MSACQNLSSGNVGGAAFKSHGETEKLQHKNNIDDLWSWGTSQKPSLFITQENINKDLPKLSKKYTPHSGF